MEKVLLENVLKENVLMGKYELLEKIGEGGSGVVYLAWDRHLECLAAVKEEKRLNGVQGAENLKKEREMLKTLRHPMLPAVYDYFGEDTQYLVMEYIEGIGLHKYIEKEGSIPEKQACEWALQIIELLSYLHERKPPVIYRDLKPDNIIVCPDGNLRVVDFGAALSVNYDMRHQNNLAGTMGYAAPEQLEDRSVSGEKADARSDIYTLGATLYHMLTGYNPSLPPYGVREARCMNPELTYAASYIVSKCTQPSPDMRYQSVEEVKKDLLHMEDLNKRARQRLGRSAGIGKPGKSVIRKIEKKIRLTEKKTTGLFGLIILLSFSLLGGLPMLVKGRETPLPVVVYNTKGQKVVIRYDSVYRPDGNLLLELDEALFRESGMQELTVSLTDKTDGKRRERVFYIKGGE